MSRERLLGWWADPLCGHGRFWEAWVDLRCSTGKAVGVGLVRCVLLCKMQGQVGLLATMTLGRDTGRSGLELLEQGSVAPLPCESHHGGVIPRGLSPSVSRKPDSETWTALHLGHQPSCFVFLGGQGGGFETGMPLMDLPRPSELTVRPGKGAPTLRCCHQLGSRAQRSPGARGSQAEQAPECPGGSLGCGAPSLRGCLSKVRSEPLTPE